MKRFVVLSDIHGNLEALNQALEMIRSLNVEAIICLGDIVGYGPDPAECCEMARKHFFRNLMGNHDAAVVHKISIQYFNPSARTALLWTEKQLSPPHKAFLSSLPYTFQTENLLFVHGTPNSPERFYYLLWDVDLREAFHAFSQWICFVGHSHRAGIYVLSEEETLEEYPRCELHPSKRYIINVGSIGQPRDGDPRSAFALVDLNEKIVEIFRISYPIELVQKKMREKGLPPNLIHRLALGM
ncbi:MAG: metallophosphoesterase family protein [bacterium]